MQWRFPLSADEAEQLKFSNNVKERGGPYELPKRNSVDIGQTEKQVVAKPNSRS
jgi:hypothetical protein